MRERGECREGADIAYSIIKNMYRNKNTHNISANMAMLLNDKYATQSSI
jgi:hypothetical protein